MYGSGKWWYHIAGMVTVGGIVVVTGGTGNVIAGYCYGSPI